MKIQSSSELYFLTTFFHWFDDRDVCCFSAPSDLYYYGPFSAFPNFQNSKIIENLNLRWSSSLLFIRDDKIISDLGLQIDLDKAWSSSSFFKCQLQQRCNSKNVMHAFSREINNEFIRQGKIHVSACGA